MPDELDLVSKTVWELAGLSQPAPNISTQACTGCLQLPSSTSAPMESPQSSPQSGPQQSANCIRADRVGTVTFGGRVPFINLRDNLATSQWFPSVFHLMEFISGQLPSAGFFGPCSFCWSLSNMIPKPFSSALSQRAVTHSSTFALGFKSQWRH